MIREFIQRSNVGPVASKQTLAIGIAVGLASGAIYLPAGTDMASAVGFISCVSFVVGTWLAYRGHALIMQAYIYWLRAIDKRLDALRIRIDQFRSVETECQVEPRRRPHVLAYAVKMSFYPTPIILSSLVGVVIMIALRSQLPESDVRTFYIIAACFLASTAVAVGGQCAYLAYLHRRVVLLERQFRRVALVRAPDHVLASEARRVAMFEGGAPLSAKTWALLVS